MDVKFVNDMECANLKEHGHPLRDTIYLLGLPSQSTTEDAYDILQSLVKAEDYIWECCSPEWLLETTNPNQISAELDAFDFFENDDVAVVNFNVLSN